MGRPLLNPTRRRMIDQREARQNIYTNRAQLVVPVPSPFIRIGGTGSANALGHALVTQGTFDGTTLSRPWETILDRLVHRALSIIIPWTTDSGTTGEVRLALVTGAGTLTTSAVALAASSSGRVTFRWLHDADPWEDQDLALYVEARRTGGANNVNIGAPLGGACQVDPTDCTTTGI